MRRHRVLKIILFIVVLLLVVGAFRRVRNKELSSGGVTLEDLSQVTTGLPMLGGLSYSGIKQNQYGSGNTAYWIFEPTNPTPATAPVIVFNHGWGGINPASYGAWIEHLVKRGNIVIYPVYQEDFKTQTSTVTGNAIAGVLAALAELNSGGSHVKPDLSKFAIVGHSAGGLITANMAALAQSKGLPKPLAVMSVEPGKTWTLSDKTRISLVDLSTIPSDALLLAVAGDQDRITKDVDAKKIFQQTPQIPVANKNFITVQSDDHGTPALKANHFAPTGRGQIIVNSAASGGSASERPLLQMIRERRASLKLDDNPDSDQTAVEVEGVGSAKGVDALDYYGFWKLFDGLTDAAFYGKNREYALGNTSDQTFMGTWSDGVPIKPLIVTTKP